MYNNIELYNIIHNVFLAGWCGDAAGSNFEFMNQKFTKEEVTNGIKMTTKIQSENLGQITDDSEMEFALLQGLINGCEDNCEYFPSNHIAIEYINWKNSEPIDIGQTTMFAIDESINDDDMYNNAYEYNTQSESNGALMRCIPLAIILMLKTQYVVKQTLVHADGVKIQNVY